MCDRCCFKPLTHLSSDNGYIDLSHGRIFMIGCLIVIIDSSLFYYSYIVRFHTLLTTRRGVSLKGITCFVLSIDINNNTSPSSVQNYQYNFIYNIVKSNYLGGNRTMYILKLCCTLSIDTNK